MELRAKLLFVDDEPSIRVLVPAILKQRGFSVTVAGTVSEALNLIATQTFDVLISDLNIGEPGDGFTVVSAMRRTQPTTATFILTGYPAFETALEAIRQQVDDYFVKPADPDALVGRIVDRLKAPPPLRTGIRPRRLPDVLKEHKVEIFTRWMANAKADRRLQAAGLSNEKLSDQVAALIEEIINASSDLRLSQDAMVAARRHGKARFGQGWSIAAVTREAHILHGVLSGIVQENLLSADISFLVTDIMHIGEAVQAFLEESLQAFSEAEQSAGQVAGSQALGSVLLLSKDPELSRLREYALRQGGYAVTRATSREDALGFLDGRFDALVISYTLSEASIAEYVEVFRRANPNGSVVGVLNGAWQDLNTELDGTVPGEEGPEALLEAVSAALARRRLRLVK